MANFEANAHVLETSAIVYLCTADDVLGRAAIADDAQPPQLLDLSPEPGSAIYKHTPIDFDVVDDQGLRLVEVQVDQFVREVAHDGDSFLHPYLSSLRYAIVGGYHFQIVRAGGWATSPTFYLRALDRGFNEPSVDS